MLVIDKRRMGRNFQTQHAQSKLVMALDNPIDTFILFHFKIDCLQSLCLGKSVVEIYLCDG